jgi:hypothetical protein
MSLVKILDINVHLLKKAATETYNDGLNHEIEGILTQFHDMDGLPYEKPDMVQLISTIERNKMKCLKGEISAKRLYRDVDYALSLFKIKHPGFDYMKDPALNAYFS